MIGFKEYLETKAQAAKKASHHLAFISTEIKNQALHNISVDLLSKQDEILASNQLDYRAAESSGMNAAMLDRLMLNPARMEGMSRDVLTPQDLIVVVHVISPDL